MSLPEWDEKKFDEFVGNKGNGVIEFSAPWCGACKATEPQIEEVSKNYHDLIFAKIDVGKNSNLASKMGVMSIPNIFVFKSGKVSDQLIGMTTAQILKTKLEKVN